VPVYLLCYGYVLLHLVVICVDWFLHVDCCHLSTEPSSRLRVGNPLVRSIADLDCNGCDTERDPYSRDLVGSVIIRSLVTLFDPRCVNISADITHT
jgi:hypothetical protein